MGFKEDLQARLDQLGLKGWTVTEYTKPRLELKLAEEGSLEADDALDVRAAARIAVAQARLDGKTWQSCFAIAAHGDELHGWNDQRAYGLFCQMIVGWELESFIQTLPLAMAGSVLEVPATVTVDGGKAVAEELSKPWFKPPVNDVNKALMTYIDEVLPCIVELHCWPDEGAAAFADRVSRVVQLLDTNMRAASR